MVEINCINCGKDTIPKEFRKKYDLKDYVKIEDTGDGILIKTH